MIYWFLMKMSGLAQLSPPPDVYIKHQLMNNIALPRISIPPVCFPEHSFAISLRKDPLTLTTTSSPPFSNSPVLPSETIKVEMLFLREMVVI